MAKRALCVGRPTCQNPGTPAISADGVLYVSSNPATNLFPSRLVILDAATGRPGGEVVLDNGFADPPIIGSDGTVYVLTVFHPTDRNLYAFRSSSPLANSSWPARGADPQNSRRAVVPIEAPPKPVASVLATDATADEHADTGTLAFSRSPSLAPRP